MMLGVRSNAMAFADPQSITISGNAISLPRVESGKNESVYLSADGRVKLAASTAYGRRTRRVLRVDHSKIAADPFIPAQNVELGMSNYLVFDTPAVGYSATEALAVYAGFKAAFSASSDLLITKLLGGES
jgi:regulator of extracellular matrix RemA (YlzA/DUF370 family)